MDIYYNFRIGDKIEFGREYMLSQKPDLVISDLKKTTEGVVWDRYRQCPAGMDFFKNLFLVRSVGNVKINHFTNPNEGARIVTDRDTEFFDRTFYIQEYEENNQVVQFTWYWTFFAEKDIEMSVMPAFMHKNSFTQNTINLPGKLNIHKWFRATQPGFVLKSDEVNIKANDPMFYLKFHTDEKINFKEFVWTEKLANYADECINVKYTSEKLGMNKLYNLFTRKNFHKKVLTELKKNTV